MIGNCLCSQVQFKIEVEAPKLYQCHCTLCRKQSGTSSNAATIVLVSQFSWLQGEETISSFVKDTGFRSDFCSNCGSPVPNPLGATDKYWIPAGLLEKDCEQDIVAHLYTESKACWDPLSSDGKQFKDMPKLEELYHLLNSPNNSGK